MDRVTLSFSALRAQQVYGFLSLTTLSFNQLQSIVNFEQDGQETLQRGKHAQQGGPRFWFRLWRHFSVGGENSLSLESKYNI